VVESLGFSPDARVLIVNCDDFGMSPSINAGVVRAIDGGIASSCSLMVPCDAAADAMQILHERPDIPFGVHLTLVRDSVKQRWSPICSGEEVPSLLDGSGVLPLARDIPALLAQARLEEIEREFRAQIEVVLRAGLKPTHLDWHCLADGGRGDVMELTLGLALEYGSRCGLGETRHGRSSGAAALMPSITTHSTASASSSTASSTATSSSCARCLSA